MNENDFRENANNLEASTSMWLELANASDTPDLIRSVIYDFFIPYKISAIKFAINKDATDDPFRYMMYEDDPLFSKTLKCFQEDPSLKALGYPDWFYCAFPDVAFWAIKGMGKSIILEKFKFFTEDDLISNNRIKNVHLKTIIDLYIKYTGKSLEVGV